MLPVQLAEAFLLAEAVELGWDDGGGGLVGGGCELGIELQGGGALCVAPRGRERAKDLLWAAGGSNL